MSPLHAFDRGESLRRCTANSLDRLSTVPVPYPSAITSLLEAGIHSMDTVAARRSAALRIRLPDEFGSPQLQKRHETMKGMARGQNRVSKFVPRMLHLYRGAVISLTHRRAHIPESAAAPGEESARI
jgi:hypothetical protein